MQRSSFSSCQSKRWALFDADKGPGWTPVYSLADFTSCTNGPNRKLHPTFLQIVGIPCSAGAIRTEHPNLGAANGKSNVPDWVVTEQ
jgi:hypothetical protein